MKFTLCTPRQAATNLVQRIRKRRKFEGLTQSELAEKAGIPLSTYSLFERTGEASLANVLRVAMVLGEPAKIVEIIPEPEFRSLDDVEKSVELERKRIQ